MMTFQRGYCVKWGACTATTDEGEHAYLPGSLPRLREPPEMERKQHPIGVVQ